MPITKTSEGTKLRVKISPNASQNSIAGVIDIGDNKKALKINIKAVPEDGKANKELISFLSKTWKISKNNIDIISWHSNKIKNILIKKGINLEL